MAEKKEWLSLKTMEDAIEWFEKTANEVTENPHSIAQNNARNASVKGLIALQRLALDYKRLVNKDGGRVVSVQKFLGHE